MTSATHDFRNPSLTRYRVAVVVLAAASPTAVPVLRPEIGLL